MIALLEINLELLAISRWQTPLSRGDVSLFVWSLRRFLKVTQFWLVGIFSIEGESLSNFSLRYCLLRTTICTLRLYISTDRQCWVRGFCVIVHANICDKNRIFKSQHFAKNYLTKNTWLRLVDQRCNATHYLLNSLVVHLTLSKYLRTVSLFYMIPPAFFW